MEDEIIIHYYCRDCAFQWEETFDDFESREYECPHCYSNDVEEVIEVTA